MRISDELKRYAVDLVAATRTAAGVQLGASPRASIALMKTAQALALVRRRWISSRPSRFNSWPCRSSRTGWCWNRRRAFPA